MTAPLHIRTEVAPGVHFVQGPASNWVILTTGGPVSLIDCGYPGDWDVLVQSLTEVGAAPADVRWLFVTHAHSDHIGSAERLRAQFGTEVLACHDEAIHTRRLVLHQVSVDQVMAARETDPLVTPWMEHALSSDGLRDVAVAEVTELAEDMPGPGPFAPCPHVIPGHTPGHTVFELPTVSVLVTGDALVTGHATSTHDGPQLLHTMFHTDPAMVRDTLDQMATITAQWLLPGHGPVVNITPQEAVQAALAAPYK